MWWNKKFNKWINLCLENPLKTWKLAKKYFKKPKVSIHFFSNIIYNCPYESLNHTAKLLDIISSDVSWKEKYGTPRHEMSPYIWICFFRRFGFSINWHIHYYDEFGKKQSGDMYYWEYLLDYVYFRKNLTHLSSWTSISLLYTKLITFGKKQEEDIYEPIDTVIPIAAMSLNEDGIEELKRIIDENNSNQ